MSILVWTILVCVALLIAALAARRLERNPRGDIESGIAFVLGRFYVRLYHCLRVHGREHIPPGRDPGPLIVVANHTAGIDPVLIQASCPFPIRWIMASDMRAPTLEWFWQWQRIIFVGRDRSSMAVGMRTAIEHLKNGGVVGIFPEGGIERPARRILPFHPGLGMLVRKTRARVLPVFVDNTPQIDPAWASLWVPSRSRIEFGPMLSPDRTPSAVEISRSIRALFVAWTGWPVNDFPDPADIESAKTAGPYGSSVPPTPEDERSAA